MSRNWIRAASLQVGDGGGRTIDLSQLRIRFLIRQWTTQSTNPGEFRVYNLSDETAHAIAGKGSEFKHLRFSAGYEGNIGVIYKGSVLQSRIGRETPTDTFVDFYCRDGDEAYNWGVVNKTFAAGSTQRDHVDEVLRVFKKLGVTGEGTIKGLSKKKYPRAVTLYGMGRDVMRTIAQSNGATWNILNGELNHIPNDDKGKSSGAFVLNANTGLIGMPQETVDGIIVTALLNPHFKLNTQLIINEKSIQRAAWGQNAGVGAEATAGQLDTLGTADGTYRIISIEWRGDSRGQEWYATMICYGAKTGAPPISSTGIVGQSSAGG